MNQAEKQLIHLLYVPTIYCNLGCEYCYLGKQTDSDERKLDWQRALPTLQYAVDKFHQQDIVPFNISLHGGEVTTLPKDVMSDLFDYITNYYKENSAVLYDNGFKKTNPHIKTNLYNFNKHYELMDDHHVSISASVDLPLSLHDRYRTTKKGGSTLGRTLNNISLLSKYPHDKKLSCVLFYEHLSKTDEIIKDIWKLHREYGIDMNRFNFMFGFESNLNNNKFNEEISVSTETISDEDQVLFYQAMKKEFVGTELEAGFRTHWFDEFKPTYCTNSFNCGEKFFLLQSNGDIYSCVRGQGSDPFLYGNIFENTVEEILDNANSKILTAHRAQGMHKDCKQCHYLSICQTGCAFVKTEINSAKSYTCALQKEIYKDYPDLYPASDVQEHEESLNEYIVDMHPQLITSELMPGERHDVILPNDLYENNNALADLISTDSKLQALYSSDSIYIEINEDCILLESQILKPERNIFTLNSHDVVKIHIRKSLFRVNCKETIRNSLLFQCLRDTPVVYGDEKRTKQEHIFNFEMFQNILSESALKGDEYYAYDISELLYSMRQSFKKDILNNLFVTTGYLRKYHYEKQKENAYYHIQAINLPFHNFEFYWQ
jgi:uncharacterized protein